jgi:hypothetical protein
MTRPLRGRRVIITDVGEAQVTIDSVEAVQFTHLLLHNEKIRDLVETVGRKGVLILGRFTRERKIVLDALRNELRKRDYVPSVFRLREASKSNDRQHYHATCAHGAVRDRRHLRRAKFVVYLF